MNACIDQHSDAFVIYSWVSIPFFFFFISFSLVEEPEMCVKLTTLKFEMGYVSVLVVNVLVHVHLLWKLNTAGKWIGVPNKYMDEWFS